jgi:hypothetical protein
MTCAVLATIGRIFFFVRLEPSVHTINMKIGMSLDMFKNAIDILSIVVEGTIKVIQSFEL